MPFIKLHKVNGDIGLSFLLLCNAVLNGASQWQWQQVKGGEGTKSYNKNPNKPSYHDTIKKILTYSLIVKYIKSIIMNL